MKKNRAVILLTALLAMTLQRATIAAQPEEVTELVQQPQQIREKTAAVQQEQSKVKDWEQHETIDEATLIEICEDVGKQYDLCPELLQAMAWHESRYEVKATSDHNAKGLCQIIEKWHEDRIARLGVTDIYEPTNNVLVAADYIAELHERNGDDIYLVLMCYNMGEVKAKELYKQGKVSSYAREITSKAEELEREHGK